MLPIGRAFQVWAYPAPVDLRNGFLGLTELARKHLRPTAEVGACFLFVNQHLTRAKVLHYDGSGWGLYHKRLDSGVHFPQLWDNDADPAKPGAALTLSWAELMRFIRRTPAQRATTSGAKPPPRAPGAKSKLPARGVVRQLPSRARVTKRRTGTTG